MRSDNVRQRLTVVLITILLALSGVIVFDTPAHASRPLFQMPFPCGEVWRASTYTNHGAIDWNMYPDDNNRVVVASAPGIASLIYEPSHGGYMVSIDHGNGWKTVYAHLQPNGRASGTVAMGQTIGYVGTTGASTAPHLHWEQKFNNVRQTPLYADGVALNPGFAADQTAPAYTSNNCSSFSGVGDRISILNGAGEIWAKDQLGNGGWAQQTGPNSAKAIAVGGSTQVLTDLCGAIWAKNTLSFGGWVQETGCNSAKSVAVGSTGAQVILDLCGAIWSKTTIGFGGWAQEAGCGSASSVAVGGNAISLVNPCGAIWSKPSLTSNTSGWNQQTACNSAKSVAVSNTGVQVLIDLCDSVWAKAQITSGGWVQETGCGSAKSVAIGGNTQFLLDFCGAVYARVGIVYGNWPKEADCNSAKAIAIGTNGRRVLLSLDNAIWAKEGALGLGGWAQQASASSAVAIAVG